MSAATHSPTNGTSERPFPRTLLPFRVVPGRILGRNNLEYEAEVQVPFAGPRLTRFSFPMADGAGPAIFKLMEMYWELEATTDKVAAERDALQVSNSELQGEVERLQSKLLELERRKIVDKGAKK